MHNQWFWQTVRKSAELTGCIPLLLWQVGINQLWENQCVSQLKHTSCKRITTPDLLMIHFWTENRPVTHSACVIRLWNKKCQGISSASQGGCFTVAQMTLSATPSPLRKLKWPLRLSSCERRCFEPLSEAAAGLKTGQERSGEEKGGTQHSFGLLNQVERQHCGSLSVLSWTSATES